MHGGSEITMIYVKHMDEKSADEFVKNINETDLAQSLQNDREDHLDARGSSEIGFDKGKGTHFVELRFYMEIEDMANVEAWCAEEGFENTGNIFGSRG